LDNDINFTYDLNTEVYESCAATLDGEMFVLGGWNEKKQISKVQNCKLNRVGEMPFDFYEGACNTFPFGIMLCFSHDAKQECHSFHGTSFKTEPSSKFSHDRVSALGSYRNSPFVTGSYDSTNGLKTEFLNFNAEEWNGTKDYPFSNGDR